LRKARQRPRASRRSGLNIGQCHPGFEPGGPQAQGLASFLDQVVVAMFVSSCHWARGLLPRSIGVPLRRRDFKAPYKSQKRETKGCTIELKARKLRRVELVGLEPTTSRSEAELFVSLCRWVRVVLFD